MLPELLRFSSAHQLVDKIPLATQLVHRSDAPATTVVPAAAAATSRKAPMRPDQEADEEEEEEEEEDAVPADMDGLDDDLLGSLGL